MQINFKLILYISVSSLICTSCGGSWRKAKEPTEVVEERPLVDETSYKSLTIIDDAGVYQATCVDFSDSTYTTEQIELKSSEIQEQFFSIKVELSNDGCSNTHNDLKSHGYCLRKDENGQLLKLRLFVDSRSVLGAQQSCEFDNGTWVYDNPMSCTFISPTGAFKPQCHDFSYSSENFDDIKSRCTEGAIQSGSKVLVSQTSCPKKLNSVNSLGSCQITNDFYHFEYLLREYDVNKTIDDKNQSCGWSRGIWNIDL